MKITDWDVLVLGAGPAGLAAAVSASDGGARTVLLEREERPGGILKQCIHDGFGVVQFGEKITGPEYAYRYIKMAEERKIPLLLETFLTRLEEVPEGFLLTTVNPSAGLEKHRAKAIVLATGCRERTDRQVFIHGERPAGIYTAGLAQYFVNIQGLLPGKKAVILGSGDIGLIMARRLTLEGMEVEGVYEIKKEPSGLTRNIVQCLLDYDIPLHLSSTIVKVHGLGRVSSVTAVSVDENLKPLPGTEREIPCDTLILSVGLIPENEVAEKLSLPSDSATRGPSVDQRSMTEKPGVFICGNALQVNDLVDYVSENGHAAGRGAAEWAGSARAEDHSKEYGKNGVPVAKKGELLTLVPQRVVLERAGEVPFFFRSARTFERVVFTLKAGEKTLVMKKYPVVRPPEMERLTVDLSGLAGNVKVITAELAEEKE